MDCISARQGGHQVAHKLTSTACPRRSESLIGFTCRCFQFEVRRKESLLRRRDFPGRGVSRFVCADEYPGNSQDQDDRINDSALSLLHYGLFFGYTSIVAPFQLIITNAMIIPDSVFVGVHPSYGRKSLTFALLDNDLRLIELADSSLEDISTILSETRLCDNVCYGEHKTQECKVRKYKFDVL